MDFFARQEESKRATGYLVLLFALAFLGVAAAASIAVAVVLNLLPDLNTPLLSTTVGRESQFAWLPVIGVAGGVLLLMLLASLYRSASLAGGGGRVARMLGATPIGSDVSDPLHRRLVNVVEEMAISSGMPVPEIYVLEHEPAINAFAAGLRPANAAITVTQGALARLDRAELQGVIAHEFGHILNGDMRLNQRLIGYCFGILVLALAGRWLLRSARFARRSRERGLPVALLLGLAFIVIGSIGILFSRLIKAAVSRQRESLADASAVQFTREPSGLAGALKKIAGYTANLSSVDSEEVAHMLFGPGSKAFRGLFATHPPLIERIQALDPSFDPATIVAADEMPPQAAEPLAESASAFAAAAPTARLSNDALLDRAGTIDTGGAGEALHSAIPADLLDAAHSRETSLLLVLAMALSPDRDAADRQQRLIAQRLGARRAERCAGLRRELDAIDTSLHMPLLELAMPALKQRPDEQLHFLFDMLHDVLIADPEYRLPSFVLPHMLAAFLAGRSGMRARGDSRPLPSVELAINELFAAIAVVGHAEPDVAERAYRAGIESLRLKRQPSPRIDTRYLTVADSLAKLGAALDRLALLKPAVKRELLRAALVTIRDDENVRAEEIELFRAVAAALECPVPPLAAGPVANAGEPRAV